MRPRIYVLAGVNGAGKSSVIGQSLTSAGVGWFNPDTYARQLQQREECDWSTANVRAAVENIRRFRAALSDGHDYAFETTLGGQTMVRKLIAAASTHDIIVWYCGLDTVGLHVSRVHSRIEQGGHAIPARLIGQRCVTAPRNLIALLPHLSRLQVYDNSATVRAGEPLPDPRLVLDLTATTIIHPRAHRPEQLRLTPAWAVPIVEAALQLQERRGR